MAERKAERKTGHSSDQWFKLKAKTPKNDDKKHQEAKPGGNGR